MHQEEADQLVACGACGARVLAGVERAYAFGADSVLCWSCAVERGGVYDDEQDRWVTEPSMDGLHSET